MCNCRLYAAYTLYLWWYYNTLPCDNIVLGLSLWQSRRFIGSMCHWYFVLNFVPIIIALFCIGSLCCSRWEAHHWSESYELRKACWARTFSTLKVNLHSNCMRWQLETHNVVVWIGRKRPTFFMYLFSDEHSAPWNSKVISITSQDPWWSFV